MLHRLTGLGVVLFLTLHVIDTSWAVFFPEKYVEAIAIYQSPLFTIGEFALVFCVVYHAFNGLRISIFDNRPELWKYQERAALVVVGLTIVVLVPVFIGMFGHVINFYNNDPQVLPLMDVIVAQLPFAGGMVAALIAGIVLSGIYGLVAGKEGRERPSGIERFWWSFMRVSGLIIVPLVFGHLAMMHVLQGVFDLQFSAADAEHAISAIGAVGQGVNVSGTAVEFVGDRWNTLVAGVAVWRVYDFLLLLLVTMHGFNGLRYVLTDYTMSSPLLRRAMIYLSIIGALVLLIVGGLALFGTIDESAIQLAQEALQNLHP